MWTDIENFIEFAPQICPEKHVPYLRHSVYVLTCIQTGNQRLWPRCPRYFRLSRFVSPIQDFSDQGASSHIFSLAQYYTCAILIFKSISNKVSFFGRQIFSFKRSYFRLVWENSTWAGCLNNEKNWKMINLCCPPLIKQEWKREKLRVKPLLLVHLLSRN